MYNCIWEQRSECTWREGRVQLGHPSPIHQQDGEKSSGLPTSMACVRTSKWGRSLTRARSHCTHHVHVYQLNNVTTSTGMARLFLCKTHKPILDLHHSQLPRPPPQGRSMGCSTLPDNHRVKPYPVSCSLETGHVISRFNVHLRGWHERQQDQSRSSSFWTLQ